MKSYPSIPSGKIQNGQRTLFVFDKIDGSNVRAEWDRKKGFVKFGRRNGLLDDQTPFLIEAKDLMLEAEEVLAEACRPWKKATLFFEFYGKSSFCGVHKDEKHYVRLIDVSPDRYPGGFLNPGDFVNHFGETGYMADLLLTSDKFDYSVLMEAKERLNREMTAPWEGVVVKASSKKRHGRPLMYKVKTREWLNAVKSLCYKEDGSFDEAKYRKIS